MKNLKPLLPYLLGHKLALLAGFAVTIVSTLLALAQPYLIGSAIDSLQRGRPAGVVYTLALEILGLAAVQGIFTFQLRYFFNKVSRQIEYEMRRDFFAHLERMPQSFFGEMHTGDIMARATNDMSAVRSFLGPGILNTTNTSLMFVLAAVPMFGIDAGLAVIALVFLPVVSIAFTIVGRRMNQHYEKVQAQFGVLSTHAQENFSGIRVIKAYGQEDLQISDFAVSNREYVRRSMAYQRLSGLLWPTMGLVLGLTTATILFVGGSDVIDGRISLGQFVQFNGYLGMLSWPMIALGWVVNLYQQGAASLTRIMEVMSHDPEIRDHAETRPISTIRGSVTFRDVHLSYDGRKVLDGLSFDLPAGKTLAILGATGVGKTSIVNLISRVHEAQSGQVLVDGVDVRNIPLAVLRRSLGMVPQDTYLFSVALRENVAFGVDMVDEGKLAQAVTVARLSNDIDQFPGGLDTVIGERGVTLSGGQKQRTAIARAVMRDPAILILDDALSSIDTATQAEILGGLKHVLANRTSIIIAHRVSTVKAADSIIVLEDGRVAEQGRHTELLALNGRYAAMYRRELLSQEMEVE
ncbi:MAG: ABC transporter ATP-binding protein [Chloroflexia bacterium]